MVDSPDSKSQLTNPFPTYKYFTQKYLRIFAPMKRLHWLVLSSYIRPFLMSFSIVMFILVVQFVSVYMERIAGKGVGIDVFFKLFYYAAGRISITALPVSILAAGLITFGNMGEQYELASIKSAGISLFRYMRPTIIFALVVMGFSFWASFYVIPQANLKFFSLLYDISRKKPELVLQPGHFYRDIDGYVIRVSDKNPESGNLLDVLIYDHSNNQGNTNIILADSGKAEMYANGGILRMRLYSGSRHEEYPPEAGKPNTRPYGRTYFDSLYYAFNLEGFDLSRTDEKQFKHEIILPLERLRFAVDSIRVRRGDRVKRYISQLARNNVLDTLFVNYSQDSTDLSKFVEPYELDGVKFIDCLDPDHVAEHLENTNSELGSIDSYITYIKSESREYDKTYRKYRYEYFNRFAMPINCLLFMLLGVSLGAIIRKGGIGAPALVSTILFMIFYVLISQGKKMSKEGVIDPFIGAWLPVMVFLPISALVTYQATTDSKILDESVWAMVRDRVSYVFQSVFSRKKVS